MSVPVLGNYLSGDECFRIEIASATPSNGRIEGTYSSRYSPVGELSVDGEIENYSWVFSKKQGKNGVAPFLISFMASQRPEDWPYAIRDTWAGAYQEDNTILLTGSRAYVDQDGAIQSICLGTQTFTRR